MGGFKRDCVRFAHGVHSEAQLDRCHLERSSYATFYRSSNANPATVRSKISARSNFANTEKMPKTSLPAALVVSIAAACPVNTSGPLRAVMSCPVLIKWRKFRPSLSGFQAASMALSRSALRQAAKPD
jgi:hypothetical protein